jgi:hypothetical protein
MNERLRHVIKILPTVALVFAVGGCDTIQTTQNPNKTALVSPLNSPSPLETADKTQVAETETPHPVGFVTESNGRIGWYSENGDHLITPNIPGLTAEIKDGNVIYIAQKGNEYGLKVDGKTEVARYKTDVMESGIRVSGVVVDGRIAATLMKTQSDAFPIPVNPDGQLGIIYYTQNLPTADNNAIAFTYSGETPFYNPYLNNKGVYCSVQSPWDSREWSIFANADVTQTTTSGANSVIFSGLIDTETKTDTVTASNYQVGGSLMPVPGAIYATAPEDLSRFNLLQVDGSFVLLGTP